MNKTLQRLFLGLSVAALLALSPVAAPAATPAGKVLYAFGAARAVDKAGAARRLRRGASVFPGDKLTTGARGRAQVRFTDGGFISLKRNSVFQIDEFRYAGKTDGSERGFFSLLRGALRAVTGAVGRANKRTYRIKTPIATIGIRGTSFLLTLCAGDCFAPDGSPIPDGLYASTGDGTITISNGAGVLELIAGQSAYTESEDSAPQQTAQPAPVAIDTTGAPTPEPFEAGSQRDDSGFVPGTGGTQFEVFTNQTVATAFNDADNSAGFPDFHDVAAFFDSIIVTGSPPLFLAGTDSEDGTFAFALALTPSLVDTLIALFPELQGPLSELPSTVQRQVLFSMDDPATPASMGPDLLITRWFDGTAVVAEDQVTDGFVTVNLQGDESLLFASTGNPTLAAGMGFATSPTGVVNFELAPGNIPVFGSGLPTSVVPGSGQMELTLGGGGLFGYGQVNSLQFDIDHNNSGQIISVWNNTAIPLRAQSTAIGKQIGFGGPDVLTGSGGPAGSYMGTIAGVLIGNELTAASTNTPTHAVTTVELAPSSPSSTADELVTAIPWQRTSATTYPPPCCLP